MNDELQELLREFDLSAEKLGRLCYITRDRDLQVQACENLVHLNDKFKKAKQEAIAAQNEESANLILFCELVIKSLSQQIKMWLCLKENDPNSAWGCLVEAQMAARQAMIVHPSGKGIEEYLERLHALEVLIFPPQIFMSSGFVIEKADCSICGEEYGECDHLRGKPYWGNICRRIVKDVRLIEASIVERPKDKRCRVLQFSDGGVYKDAMTLKIVETTPDSNYDCRILPPVDEGGGSDVIVREAVESIVSAFHDTSSEKGGK